MFSPSVAAVPHRLLLQPIRSRPIDLGRKWPLNEPSIGRYTYNSILISFYGVLVRDLYL